MTKLFKFSIDDICQLIVFIVHRFSKNFFYGFQANCLNSKPISQWSEDTFFITGSPMQFPR